MNKRANRELLPVRIIIAVAIVAIFAASLWLCFGQESVAMQEAREAHAQFMRENPDSEDKDFIYIYNDTIIVAIRNGKVVRKEYTTEADAVKAALSSKDGANYSLAGTGNGKLFVVKLFEKTPDIFALGTSTLANGADKLSIKVVSNGMIFASFEIPAEAIDRKESPVCITVKKIDPEDNITLGKNETGFAYDIDVDNLVENNTSLIKVTMNGPKGLSPSMNKKAITVYHKNKAIASTYNPAKGEISFETTNFSPYTFTYQMITVNSLADLRYYLQREASGNIMLGDNFADADENGNIVIDLSTMREGTDTDDFYKETKGNDPYSKYDDEKVYYAKASIDGTTAYFGALVIGDMTIDLNGKTIVYKADATKDAALFAVGNNSSLTIVDSSEGKTGTIKVPYDQHAIWSVDYTSAVSIHGGNFVKGAKSGTQTGRALLYSSGGKINVYAGSSFDFGTDANGGFNVLDKVGSTRIWIHEGVKLSHTVYCPGSDASEGRIMLFGGADLSEKGTDGWYTVQGQKLQVKVEHTDKMLYRVGNKNAFPIGLFFKLVDGATAPENIDIHIVDIIDTDNEIAEDKNNNADKFNPDSGYYGSIDDVPLDDSEFDYDVDSSDWTKSTLKFVNFSGPVRVELCEKDDKGNVTVVYASINLEVVDGTNVTKTKIVSADSTNHNICLLEDISTNGTINVSGGYSLFGNGFEIEDTRTSDDKTTKEKTGIVQVTNGAMENVRVKGYQVTTAGKVLSGEFGHAPAVRLSDNAKVYNSYIYGGGYAVLTGAGTVLLDNVTLEGGSFCNMYVWGATNLTIRDCTTSSDTTGVGAVALGIVVTNSGAKLKLEGSLTQYNWLTDDYVESIEIQGISAMKVMDIIYNDNTFAYTDKNGNVYVNMGIFFVDAESTGGTQFQEALVTSLGMLDITAFDEDYDFCDQTASEFGVTVKATAYTQKSSQVSPENLQYTNNYTPGHYNVYKPTFSYNNSPNANVGDECKYENGAISVSISDVNAGVTLDLSGISLKRYDYTGTYGLWYSYTDANGVQKEVKVTDPKVFTLDLNGKNHKAIIRAAVSGCTPSGVRDDSVFAVYTYEIPISVAVTAIPAPEWDSSLSATNAGTGVWLVHNYGKSDPDYAEAMVLYNGLKVKIYDSPTSSHIVDLTSQTAVPTVSSTSNTTATVFFEGIGTLTITGANFNGTYSFHTADGKVYVYFSSYKRNNRTDNPTVTLTYQFTDLNGQNTKTNVKMSCSFSESSPGTYIKMDKFLENPGKYETCSGEPCVTPDTLITLADGTQVRVDSLTGKEQLLVWNLKTGKYEAAPIVFVDSDAEEEFEIIHLYFSDGSDVKVIGEHGFFDLDLGKYVYIDANNYADYVGHRFVSEGDISKDTWDVVTLDEVKLETEVTTAWSPVTFEHLCYYTNGVLSMPGGIEGLFNIFEVDTETMTYDAQKMQQDIEIYGLFTYEDFGGMIPELAFEAFNGQYLKVAIGKGMLTWEQIEALAKRYVPLM
ncbi:MAG: hypothetical protein E7453_06420 [Ruminococcaceae bacterium]|nr:hypothetical protein [Oscillospiraceae bacterium]